MIKRSCEFMEGSSSVCVTALSGLVTTCSKVFWPSRWKLLIVPHYLAKFGGHKRCGNRDIKDLIFHVTLNDQRALRTYGNKLIIVYLHSLKFLLIGIAVLIYNVFRLPHDFKRQRDYMVM